MRTRTRQVKWKRAEGVAGPSPGARFRRQWTRLGGSQRPLCNGPHEFESQARSARPKSGCELGQCRASGGPASVLVGGSPEHSSPRMFLFVFCCFDEIKLFVVQPAVLSPSSARWPHHEPRANRFISSFGCAVVVDFLR
jgi:hypothetical protein